MDIKKKTKVIKLTETQKGEIRIVLAANRYFEAIKKQTEKESEKWFMGTIEKILNHPKG